MELTTTAAVLSALTVADEATHPAPTPAAPHATTCLNCDTALTGRFCAHCGQPATTHRLSMEHLLHDIPHTIWHVDKGLLYTLRELLLRPGATLLGYLRGQRARHFAPLSLLLLVAGAASFLSIKLHIGELAAATTARSTELQELQVRSSNSMMQYLGWIYVVMSPLIGWVVRRVLRRIRLNLAEAIVVVLYITAASNLLTLLLTPFYYWARTGASYGWLSAGLMLVAFGYQSWAYGQLLLGTSLRSFGRWWRGLVAAISAYLVVVTAGTIIMFALNWGSFKAAMRHEVERQQALHPKPNPAAPAQH